MFECARTTKPHKCHRHKMLEWRHLFSLSPSGITWHISCLCLYRKRSSAKRKQNVQLAFAFYRFSFFILSFFPLFQFDNKLQSTIFSFCRGFSSLLSLDVKTNICVHILVGVFDLEKYFWTYTFRRRQWHTRARSRTSASSAATITVCKQAIL